MSTTPMTADRLLSVLRAEGIAVHEHTGWRTHNRDAATGKTFGPVYGVLIHHTAGHNDREVCFNGRSDLPGPLCHSWLGKTDGLWMIGHGRANHAGLVDGDVVRALMNETSPLPRDDEADTDGNDCLYGLEIENLGDGHDPYPAGQYDAAVRWAAAVCRFHGWSERSVAGHKEVQPGKVDPSFDMDVFRAAVAARLAHDAGWNPKEDDVTPEDIKKIATEVVDLLTGPRRADLAAAVFQTDGVLANPYSATAPDNPYVWAETLLKNAEAIGRRIDGNVKDIEAKVDALAVGGVDLDALAAKVADLLAARLAN